MDNIGTLEQFDPHTLQVGQCRAPPTWFLRWMSLVSRARTEGTMDIDWHQVIWEGRWTALEMLWSAVVISVTTHWWFGPLLAVIVLTAGWKKLARFGVYVAKTFGHSQAG